MKVVIFGAGISGLTVAHELVRSSNNYDISIYEKNSEIGGLARSGTTICNGKVIPTEYSWKGFYGFYKNIPRILSEIPVASAPNSQITVFDHLIDYKHMNFSSTTLFSPTIIEGVTSCTERLIAEDKKWGDITRNNLPLRRLAGPWLGLDREKASFYSIITVGIEQAYLFAPPCKVMDGPTNQIWFNNWQKLLENNGVKFFLNTELESIVTDISANLVKGAYVATGYIEADIFIFALPIQILAKIPQLFSHNQLEDLNILCRNNLQTQLGFQLYFNKKINFGNTNGFFLLDSKWNLAILIWDNVYTDIDLSIWSITICYSYAPGLNGKTFEECTYDEIINEIWDELVESKMLDTHLKTLGNTSLTKSSVKCWSPLWPTFNISDNFINGNSNRSNKAILINNEPIPTNDAGTLLIRPSIFTKYENAFISNGYVKETIDIFSMESAATAGINVSNIIKTGKSDVSASVYNISTGAQRPLVFAPLRCLDSLCFSLGLPNIWYFWIIIILVIIYYLVIWNPKNDIKLI